MIRLTSHENGSHFYVNPEQIRAINFKDGATQVWMGTISASATESPQEVARKVLEWRLASMDFQQDGAIKRKAIIDLYTLAGLAGLEEPKNAHP